MNKPVDRLWTALTERHGSSDGTWLSIGRADFDAIVNSLPSSAIAMREAAAKICADAAVVHSERADSILKRHGPKRRAMAHREAMNALMNAESGIAKLPIEGGSSAAGERG